MDVKTRHVQGRNSISKILIINNTIGTAPGNDRIVVERHERFSIESSQRIYLEKTQLEDRRTYFPTSTSSSDVSRKMQRIRDKYDSVNHKFDQDIEHMQRFNNWFENRKDQPATFEILERLNQMACGKTCSENRPKFRNLTNHTHHSRNLDSTYKPTCRTVETRSSSKDFWPSKSTSKGLTSRRLSSKRLPPQELPPKELSPRVCGGGFPSYCSCYQNDDTTYQERYEPIDPSARRQDMYGYRCTGGHQDRRESRSSCRQREMPKVRPGSPRSNNRKQMSLVDECICDLNSPNQVNSKKDYRELKTKHSYRKNPDKEKIFTNEMASETRKRVPRTWSSEKVNSRISQPQRPFTKCDCVSIADCPCYEPRKFKSLNVDPVYGRHSSSEQFVNPFTELRANIKKLQNEGYNIEQALHIIARKIKGSISETPQRMYRQPMDSKVSESRESPQEDDCKITENSYCTCNDSPLGLYPKQDKEDLSNLDQDDGDSESSGNPQEDDRKIRENSNCTCNNSPFGLYPQQDKGEFRNQDQYDEDFECSENPQEDNCKIPENSNCTCNDSSLELYPQHDEDERRNRDQYDGDFECSENPQEDDYKIPENSYCTCNDSPLGLYPQQDKDELCNMDQEVNGYSRLSTPEENDIGYETARSFDTFQQNKLNLECRRSDFSHNSDPKMSLVEKGTCRDTFQDNVKQNQVNKLEQSQEYNLDRGQVEKLKQSRKEEQRRSLLDWAQELKYDCWCCTDGDTPRSCSSGEHTCIEDSSDDWESYEEMPMPNICPCMYEIYHELMALCQDNFAFF